MFHSNQGLWGDEKSGSEEASGCWFRGAARRGTPVTQKACFGHLGWSTTPLTPPPHDKSRLSTSASTSALARACSATSRNRGHRLKFPTEIAITLLPCFRGDKRHKLHSNRLRRRSLTCARSSSMKATATVGCAWSQKAPTMLSRVIGVSRGALSFGLDCCRVEGSGKNARKTGRDVQWQRLACFSA